MQRPPLIPTPVEIGMLFGINPAFAELSPVQGQVTHALLTRAPLYSPSCPGFLVRLACVRHAGSVRSEPGSNSPVIILINRNYSLNPKAVTSILFSKSKTTERKFTYFTLYHLGLPFVKRKILKEQKK